MGTTARSVNCVLAGLSQKKEEPPTHPADILLAEVRKRRKELWRQHNPELAPQETESDPRTGFVSWVERGRSHLDWCQQRIKRASDILEDALPQGRERSATAALVSCVVVALLRKTKWEENWPYTLCY